MEIENNIFNSVDIYCGVGNNGGDGLVMARLFHLLNIRVNLYLIEFSIKYSTDFKLNLNNLPDSVTPFVINELNSFKNELKSDIIIDAIFGSGLTREINSTWIGEVVQFINDSKSKDK